MQEDVRAEAAPSLFRRDLKPAPTAGLPAKTCAKARSCCRPAAARRAGRRARRGIGLTTLHVPGASASRCSRPATRSSTGQPAPPAALYDANRTLLDGMLDRLGAKVSDSASSRTTPQRWKGDRSRRARHDLVLTSGGVSTGEADHAERRGKNRRLVFWRVAIKPGRPVAMGVIAAERRTRRGVRRPAGHPVAAFVTFARVVRPLFLRLAGALPEPLTALPVRLAFPYKRRPDGRRIRARRAARFSRRDHRGVKQSAEGRRRHHSLTENRRARRAFSEDTTTVEPGSTSDFSRMRR